jgi:calcineurin-like phosphoesterase family protein
MTNFVLADSHFFHHNIIGYTNRPFKDVQEMNEFMIKKWNEVVSIEDTVYHLGDFAMGPGSHGKISWTRSRLNGKIVLMLGNHDQGSRNWFLNQGFDEVMGRGIGYEYSPGVFLSHDKFPVKYPAINLHGHVHNNEGALINCVSVELIDYTPIDLDKKIEEVRGSYGL